MHKLTSTWLVYDMVNEFISTEFAKNKKGIFLSYVQCLDYSLHYSALPKSPITLKYPV